MFLSFINRKSQNMANHKEQTNLPLTLGCKLFGEKLKFKLKFFKNWVLI